MAEQAPISALAIFHGAPSPHQLPSSFWEWLSNNALNNLTTVAVRAIHQTPDTLSEFVTDFTSSMNDQRFAWTYRQLFEAVETLAATLHDKGVRKGDHVCCFTLSCAQWVLLMWSAARLGATFVPLDPSTLNRKEEMQYMQNILNPAVIYVQDVGHMSICDEIFCNAKVKIANGVALPSAWYNFEVLAQQGQNLDKTIPDTSTLDDVVLVLFTSGSTGSPKMVPKTARNWMTEIEDYRLFAASNWTHSSRLATTTNNFRPIFCIGVVTTWSVGGTVIIPSPTFDTKPLLDSILQFDVTHMMAVPAALKMLISATSSSNNIRSLLYTGVSGDIIDTKSLQEGRERLGIKRLVAAWGMTETHPVLGWTNPDEPIPVFGGSVSSVGRPLPGSSARICYPGSIEAVTRGVKGELHIQSGSLIQGYGGNLSSSDFYNDKDGSLWFITGDLAIMNESGCVFIIGRTKDIIKCRGANLVPSIIEDYVSQKHGIETKVIGIAHKEYGSVPIAITGNNICDQTKKEVKRGATSYLGQEYVLSDIYSFNDLGIHEWPRNSSDKVDKQQLKELVTLKK